MTPDQANQPESDGVLARAFTSRLEQLGMSRREMVRRSGLSRQTLHNIEHGERIELKPSTLAAVDRALQWRTGTALALSRGDESVLDRGDALSEQDRASAYRWEIVERIQRMSLADLERMVARMESPIPGDVPMSTDDAISDALTRIDNIERRLRETVRSDATE